MFGKEKGCPMSPDRIDTAELGRGDPMLVHAAAPCTVVDAYPAFLEPIANVHILCGRCVEDRVKHLPVEKAAGETGITGVKVLVTAF